MACNLKMLVDLPIREEYKMAFLEFFQKPENQQACEKFTNAPPEQIMALIQNMEQSIGAQGAKSQDPRAASQGPGAQPPAQPPPQGGIGAMGGNPAGGIASVPQAASRSQVPPGIAPGQLADTPMPMDIPRMPGKRY